MTTSECLRAAYWLILKDISKTPRAQEDPPTPNWGSGLKQLTVPEDIQKTETSNTEKV